jgi:hypothetical protein
MLLLKLDPDKEEAHMRTHVDLGSAHKAAIIIIRFSIMLHCRFGKMEYTIKSLPLFQELLQQNHPKSDLQFEFYIHGIRIPHQAKKKGILHCPVWIYVLRCENQQKVYGKWKYIILFDNYNNQQNSYQKINSNFWMISPLFG